MDVAVFLGSGVMTREARLPAEWIAELFSAEVVMVGLSLDPVAGIDPGEVFLPTAMLDEVNPSVLVLPGGFGCRPMAGTPEIVSRIRDIALSCDAVLSISTGTLLLAATGLLEGQHASGHWLTREELAPYGVALSDAQVERHGRLFTTSGSSAAIEAVPMLVDTILYGPKR